MKRGLYKIILKILFFISIAIVIVNLFRRVIGGTGLFMGFENFFEQLSNVDSLQINFGVESFIINADWGILNGLKNFINVFAYILGVLVWLGVNLINLLLFLMQFVRILFV